MNRQQNAEGAKQHLFFTVYGHGLRLKSMTMKITEIKTLDIRFPTSRALDGSDAMNVDPDYSAA